MGDALRSESLSGTASRRSAWFVAIGWLVLTLVATATLAQSGGEPHPERASNRYRGLDGKAHTSMFGLEAQGYKIVYVIDRSASMGGSGQPALKAAKAELLASLADLTNTHRFGIVFYNETARSFNPYNDAKTIFATERNKREAARFVESIRPFDGTRHEEALRTAIRQAPDVIFWLTDADQPKLKPAEIERITKMAGGITIHAIEFGSGPATGVDNFMAKIAKATGGQHAYVDVTKLPPAEK